MNKAIAVVSSKHHRQRATACLIAAALGLGVGVPKPGLAQEEALEEIVVTGSRLLRRDLDAPSPVLVLTNEAVRSAGNITIEETLNEFPQLASDNTSSVNSGGGSGILTADLRGLDAVRTLVLVNSRRFAPSDSRGLVDLTSIPDALIERVEVLTGGASAVYGSDAIAGAINFILRDDFQGVEANYQFGESGEGDAGMEKYDLTIGGNFADGRGNAVLSASYTKRDQIFFADRDYSAISLFESGGTLVPGGSSNIPGTRVSFNSAGLSRLNGLPFDPATACPGTIGGVRFGEGGAVMPFCDPEDRFNFAPLNYLLRPLERNQISAIGHFDLRDNLTAYSELYFMENRNEWQQAPNAGGLQTSGAPRGTYLIPNYASNPVLFAPVRDFLIANPETFDPDGDGTAAIIQTGRRSVETGPRNYKYERLTYNMTTGLRGDFEVLGRAWNWDTFLQFQRAKTNESIAGQLSSLRLALGSDVTVENGAARCTNEFVGCVPVNFLGLNSVTPEAAAFISPTHGTTSVLERKIYGGTITGELLDLPAGPLAVALGYESRWDEHDFRPDTAGQGGEFTSDILSPRTASIDLDEFYAEARVPLLADLTAIDYLGLELAVRSSDYSTSGRVTTWKAGGEWALNEWVRLRGAYNVAIRAPNLDELFDTVTIGFSAGDDPCDKDLGPTAAQKQLCVAQGVLAQEIDAFDQINVGFGVQSGGNANLTQEESDTWTVGLVISPPFIEGLNLTIDYYDIQIEDAIDQLSAQQVVNSCFRSLDNNSDTCRSINRFQNGQIDYVSATLKNIATLEASGVDFQADYSFDLPAGFAFFDSAAALRLQFVGSWAFSNERVSEPGEPAIDCLGHFGGSCSGFNVFMQPESKLVFNAAYDSGPLTTRFQFRNISDFTLFPGAGNVVKSAPARDYLDLNADYAVNDQFTVYAGIDNLTDEEPPVLGFSLAGDANVDISLYDVLGRRYFAGVRFRL
ncbi:MAG: TonB-dependent receptor [Gammaproteobacteria bacterium]|nr:TonB-dependent receptor [Gammaproteobacteria bacterium]